MITWRKSNHSGTGEAGGQECVEIASLAHDAALRHSSDPDGQG
jgi:hypothetical protein